jgi:hypothetical protein
VDAFFTLRVPAPAVGEGISSLAPRDGISALSNPYSDDFLVLLGIAAASASWSSA